MSEGRLRCCGSSLFLKTRFGAGYLLSISKTRAEVDAKRIEDNVKSVVPAAKMNSSIAGEVILHLPLDSVSLFPALFTMLKQSTESLGIGSYGISITTLESVFISLAKSSRLDDDPVEEIVPTSSEQTLIFLHRSARYLCILGGVALAFLWSTCVEENPLFTAGRLPSEKSKIVEVVPQKYAKADMDIEMTAPKEIVEVPLVIESAEPSAVNKGVGDDGDDAESFISIEAVYNEEKKCDDLNPVSALEIKDSVTVPIAEDIPSSERRPLRLTLIGIQCVELFRKRYIIASRDLKGFFFQVLFPAIQIMLVLLILTININPAGNTITLNAGLFKKKAGLTPVVEFAGTFTSDISRKIAENSAISASSVAAYNSTQMSGKLLATNKKNRYGAFVFGDSVPVNITVDWNWVRVAVKSVSFANVKVNITKRGNDISATVAVGSLLSLDSSQSLPFNSSFNQATINSMLQNRNIFSQLPSQLNITDLFSRANVTLSRLLGGANIDNVDAQAKIKARTVQLELLSELICLYGIDGTLFVVNREVNAFQMAKYCFAANILPRGVKVYESNLYSKYTIMHNSTGPHGIAGFAGVSVEF